MSDDQSLATVRANEGREADRRRILTTAALIMINVLVIAGLCVWAFTQAAPLMPLVATSVYALLTQGPLLVRWQRQTAEGWSKYL